MRSFFSRALVVAFFLSMVMAPYAQVSAEDLADLPQATPIASETPVVGDTLGTEPADPPADGTDKPGGVEDVVGTPAAPDPPVSARGITPLALDGSNLDIYDVWFNGGSSQLSVEGGVLVGAVVEPGETVTLTYSNEYLILDGAQVQVTSDQGVVGEAQADPMAGIITITFTAGFATPDMPIYFGFDIPGAVGEFPECRELPQTGSNYVDVEYGLPFGVTTSQRLVSDEICQGTGLPDVDWMNFDSVSEELQVGLYFQSMAPAGHVITITYPTDLVTVSPEPVNFYRYNYTTGEDVLVATGTASDGVITITFIGVGSGEGDEWYEWAYGAFHATLNSGVCDSSAGLYYQELDEISFVASTGLVESAHIEGRLCNAAVPVKSGTWNEDGTRIIWTIDTGDLIDGAWIQDIGGPGDYDFDCSTLTVTPSNPAVSFATWFCDDYGFGLELTGADIVRATITIESEPNAEPLLSAYVNCATVNAYGGTEQDRVAAPTDGTGHGASVCAEVFPEGGGDFITKTVSDDVVDSGETLTYTVTASTSSAL